MVDWTVRGRDRGIEQMVEWTDQEGGIEGYYLMYIMSTYIQLKLLNYYGETTSFVPHLRNLLSLFDYVSEPETGQCNHHLL